MGAFLLGCSLLYFSSCTYFSPENNGRSTVSVSIDNTKTAIEEGQIHFISEDALNLVCGNINNIELTNSIEYPNSFTTTIPVKHVILNDCPFYSVYPANAVSNLYGDVQYAELPNIQIAPFDKTANYMLSEVKTDVYDDSNMPNLSFSMSQLMGLIEIRFSNSNPDYQYETLSNVRIDSQSILTGAFTFSANSGVSSVAFKDNGWKSVQSQYDNSEVLGLGVSHTTYLFVAPGTVNDAVLTIETDQHKFTKNSSCSWSVSSGNRTSFGQMNLNTFDVSQTGGPSQVKTAVCWGDSFSETGGSYPKDLSNLVGPDWEIIGGGVGGNRVYDIAARQGALGVYTSTEFVLPSSTQTITTDGLLRDRDNSLQPALCNLQGFTRALVNPCLITYGTNPDEQILCNVSSTYKNGTYIAEISRLTPGEAITIPAHSKVESYGARTYRDADLQIVYMGENGGWDPIGAKYNEHYYDNLYGYHDLMFNYSIHHKSDYIILALHDVMFNQYYWASITNRYGNRVINLHDEIPARGRELIIRTGAYKNVCDIPQSEIDRIDGGLWPVCFMFAENDAHPNIFGARAMAILVFEKMQELGYLH